MTSSNQQIITLSEKSRETETKLQQALAYASVFEVTDATSYNEAFTMIRQAREEVARLEAEAEAITKPLLAVIEHVRSLIDPKIQAAEAFDRVLRQKAATYAAGTQQRQAEAHAAAQQLLAASPTPAVEREAVARVEAAAVPKVEGVFYRTDFCYEVTDEKLLEDAFVKRVPDKTSCQAYAKLHKGDPAASRPGLRIYSRQTAVVRG